MAATTITSNSASVDYRNGAKYTAVADFYKGRHIFITGGTGFMGKVLLEKLLRSCPGIGNIYLLMRPKRGQAVQDRLKDLLTSPLLEFIRQRNPKILDQVIAIDGDVTQPELGIAVEDQQVLFKNVSVVFHSAATIKFDEQLKLSVTINMIGTKRLVQLCHKMSKLEALVHVSTAYCNCDRQVICEKVYEQDIAPEQITQLVELLDESLIDKLTSCLIGKRPNTYTFTKALAETMLREEAGSLPVVIVRPSIVLSSAEGPMRGWVDNLNGPTGIIAAAGKGIMRTMCASGDKVADFVPVDMVCNTMICAAWDIAQISPCARNIQVYNVCTGQRKPITWNQFIQLCFKYLRKHPLGEIFWYPDGRVTPSIFYNRFCRFFLQWLPAYFLDTVATIIGQKPIMVRIQEKLLKAATCLEYFTNNEWEFQDDNVRMLNEKLSAKDRQEFVIDVTTIDWHKYIEDYALGIRKYIFKESETTLPRSRAQLTRLKYIYRLTQVIAILFMWRFIFLRWTHARNLWNTALCLLLKLINQVPRF